MNALAWRLCSALAGLERGWEGGLTDNCMQTGGCAKWDIFNFAPRQVPVRGLELVRRWKETAVMRMCWWQWHHFEAVRDLDFCLLEVLRVPVGSTVRVATCPSR